MTTSRTGPPDLDHQEQPPVLRGTIVPTRQTHDRFTPGPGAQGGPMSYRGLDK